LATPLFSNIRNQLRTEAKMTATHIGQPFLHAAMKLRGVSDSFDVIDGSLFTYGGYTNFIHRDTRDHYSKEESKSIKNLIKSQPDNRFSRYVEQFEDTFGEDARVPSETTCCWCLMDQTNDYIHRQFFINITASIVMDISSHVFSDKVPQVGTTFFGSLFEHCSSRPLWVSRNGMVRVKPPFSSMYYNFAWGKHPAKKNNASDAVLQQKNADRDERHRRFVENREQSLDRSNEAHNYCPSDVSAGHRHWLHESLETRRRLELDSNRRYGRRHTRVRDDEGDNARDIQRAFC